MVEVLKSKFFDHIQPEPMSGCWLWDGTVDRDGYGVIQYKPKFILAHRWSYEFYVGKISPGLLVRHNCDNPGCCNPSHLLVGTHVDNNKDRDRRNRQAKGECHGSSKLTSGEVKDIRNRASAGEKHRHIASNYKITAGTVSNIKTGHTWGHIK